MTSPGNRVIVHCVCTAFFSMAAVVSQAGSLCARDAYTEGRLIRARYMSRVENCIRGNRTACIADVLRHARDDGAFPSWVLEYGRNTIDICPKNGILITGSALDTLSVLYLQEVEGMRRDVRTVCAGLLHNHWYANRVYENLGIAPPDLLEYGNPRRNRGAGYPEKTAVPLEYIIASSARRNPLLLTQFVNSLFLRQNNSTLALHGHLAAHTSWKGWGRERERVLEVYGDAERFSSITAAHSLLQGDQPELLSQYASGFFALMEGVHRDGLSREEQQIAETLEDTIGTRILLPPGILQ